VEKEALEKVVVEVRSGLVLRGAGLGLGLVVLVAGIMVKRRK